MYTLAVQRDFVAQHFLIGGDWGAENDWHSHHYRLEDRAGRRRSSIGTATLVDIVDVESNLECYRRSLPRQDPQRACRSSTDSIRALSTSHASSVIALARGIKADNLSEI